jgi:anti-anti-sigma regulatory factor
MSLNSPSIEYSEGVLTVTGALDWSHTAHFDEECQRLVKSGSEHPVVDLSGVQIITSPFLGILSQAALQCLNRSAPLTLRVPAKLLNLFHTLHFEKFGNIEVA